MPFDYYFLDDTFNDMYKSEQKLGAVFRYFAILTILISCLGLFGLASFTAEQRTKEIGIRKVFGASVPIIIKRLLQENLLIVVYSNILALPLAYLFMNKWLEDFAYRINIKYDIFFIAALTTLIIALLTVIFKTVNSARANPVDSLKHE